MSTLEEILRTGASAEMADLYEAVRDLCECRSPSKRHEYLERLERAYRACEGAHERFDAKVEEYFDADGTPADLNHKWTPG
jgi:hypothetical protein